MGMWNTETEVLRQVGVTGVNDRPEDLKLREIFSNNCIEDRQPEGITFL